MASVIGVQLVASTAIGIGIGYLLDRWLGTDPWMKVIFLILGSVAGFREMIRTANQASEDEAAQQEAKKRDDDRS
jgi:ATP synthase protein I